MTESAWSPSSGSGRLADDAFVGRITSLKTIPSR